MSLYCAAGGVDSDLLPQLQDLLAGSLAKLGTHQRVLIVPPDYSRVHSRSGDLTRYAWEYYGDRLRAVLPALGTHAAMQPNQISRMFGAVPQKLFRVHNWRTDVETLGEVPAEFIHEQSEGKLNYAWPAQVNRLITRGGFDLILSIGQVVPHEVIGRASTAAITWVRCMAWNASWGALKILCAAFSITRPIISCVICQLFTC